MFIIYTGIFLKGNQPEYKINFATFIRERSAKDSKTRQSVRILTHELDNSFLLFLKPTIPTEVVRRKGGAFPHA